MCSERPTFGGRLVDPTELGGIEIHPEPLNVIVERWLKATWIVRSCPNCGQDTLQALTGSQRVCMVAVAGKRHTRAGHHLTD